MILTPFQALVQNKVLDIRAKAVRINADTARLQSESKTMRDKRIEFVYAAIHI